MGRGAGGDDAARRHDVHDVREVGDQVEVVLDHEEGGAVRREGPENTGQGGHLGGVQTGGGFVEEQDVRGAGECSGEFHPAQGAGGETGGRGVP